MSDEASKWKARFDRERASRKEAERLLEDKSRELFELNESLKEKVEEEILKNKRKEHLLSEQSKLASMGEMIGNIAHQWRQPLSAICSSASGVKLQMQLGIIENHEIDKTLDDIVNTTTFLSTTIDDFRNFFRSDNEKHAFDIVDLVKSIENIIHATYQNHHIKLMFDFEKEHINYFGLSGELSQVILNILNNAKDILEEKESSEKIVTLKIYTNKDKINISISDNAGGVPDDIMDKIFEPYFTTKHQSQGTGIGLYMCREIVKNHFYGEIKVENKSFTIKDREYFGAEFIVTLPLGIDEDE